MRLFFFSSVLIFWTAGCAYVQPLIQNVNLISISQERELGEQMAASIAKEKPLVDDVKLSSKVRYIGERLVQELPRKDFDYQFYMVNDASPNAFTIPGGIIYVHTGLLEFTDDDDELAGVIAHEIGHAFERHPTKSLSRAYGVSYLVNLLFKKDMGNLRKIGLNLGVGTVLTHYGREDEREADEIAFYLLNRAGFESAALGRFFGKLQKLKGSDSPLQFLSSHPATSERIARLEKLEEERRAGRLWIPSSFQFDEQGGTSFKSQIMR